MTFATQLPDVLGYIFLAVGAGLASGIIAVLTQIRR